MIKTTERRADSGWRARVPSRKKRGINQSVSCASASQLSRSVPNSTQLNSARFGPRLCSSPSFASSPSQNSLSIRRQTIRTKLNNNLTITTTTSRAQCEKSNKIRLPPAPTAAAQTAAQTREADLLRRRLNGARALHPAGIGTTSRPGHYCADWLRRMIFRPEECAAAS